MSKSNKDKGPHQAKNKVSDIEENKNDFEVVEQNSADERKNVIVDKDFENLEFDDKVWLWWKENKVSVIVSVVASLLIIVGFNAYRMIEAKHIEESKIAYSEVKDQAGLEAFAKEYAFLDLGGVAALQAGDVEYKNGNFAKAQELYDLAGRSLENIEIAPRALIASAICQIKQGKTTEATEVLKKVAQAENVGISFKNEASYQWAVLEYSSGDKTLAKSLLDGLVKNQTTSMWAQQAEMFLKINY